MKFQYPKFHQESPADCLCATPFPQEQLAGILHVRQSAISKLERRSDMYVSTLASFVQAMGGHSEIRAVFPELGEVKLKQFSEIEEEEYLANARD